MPQIDLIAYPIKEVLPLLIRDKTTKENIIFAEEEYAYLGEGYACKDQITLEKLKNPEFALRRRVDKNAAQQQDRTKVNAEVLTPKTIVKMMVGKLEEENPGCFDQPDKTFIDLYMKSGLYPAEIVKRLYQSPKMKEIFPDGKKRLQHIFEKQVFGLAPTEIIYKIAISFILGFTDEIEIKKHNFRQADALPYAKEGRLDELLEKLYGEGADE